MNTDNKEFVWTDELVKEFTKGAIEVQGSLPDEVSLDKGLYHFKKEQSKTKVQVTHLGLDREYMTGGKVEDILPYYRFILSKTIGHDKFPAIKEAIENVLNGKEEDKLGREIKFTKPTTDSFDSAKLNRFILDEQSQWEEPRYISFDKLELTQHEKIERAAAYVEKYRNDYSMTSHRIAHSLLYPTATMNAYREPLPENKPKEQGTDTKVGWEILSFKCTINDDNFKGMVLTKIDGFYGVKDFHVTEQDLLKSKIHVINSVKRLSDGIVFSVGDSVCLNWYPPFDVVQPVKEIKVENGKVYLYYDGTSKYELQFARLNPKHQSPETLTPTEPQGKVVTDNSDVVCLSLNEVKQLTGHRILWGDEVSIIKYINEKLKQ